MTSNNLPTYIESETDQLLEAELHKDFNDLQNYAYNYRNYLLNDPQFRVFEATYVIHCTLNSVLLQLTIPTSDRNVQAVRKLCTLQRTNFP